MLSTNYLFVYSLLLYLCVLTFAATMVIINIFKSDYDKDFKITVYMVAIIDIIINLIMFFGVIFWN